MEILCAYIRQNAPAPETDDWPELEMKPGEADGQMEADWGDWLKKQDKAKARLKPGEDVQVALTVIGRRGAEQRRIEAGPGRGEKAEFPFDHPPADYDGPDDGHDPEALKAHIIGLSAWKKNVDKYDRYRLDLRNTNLRGMDLSRLNLRGADLNGTRLEGANLLMPRLQGADLGQARLQGAVLWRAWLQGAVLWRAWLQGTGLRGARLQGVQLWEARLQAALLWQARLQGADLSEARFDPNTRLTGAILQGAAVNAVDYTDVPQIAKHLPGMFGDASVTLPGGHGPEHESWPAHWPKFALNPGAFQDEWRKWQADPEGYTPPDPP